MTFEEMSRTEWASPGVTPFKPNAFVDITNYLHTKLEALAAYDMEMRPLPHSRSVSHIESLAKHRGNCMGVEAAEGFMLMRLVR